MPNFSKIAAVFRKNPLKMTAAAALFFGGVALNSGLDQKSAPNETPIAEDDTLLSESGTLFNRASADCLIKAVNGSGSLRDYSRVKGDFGEMVFRKKSDDNLLIITPHSFTPEEGLFKGIKKNQGIYVGTNRDENGFVSLSIENNKCTGFREKLVAFQFMLHVPGTDRTANVYVYSDLKTGQNETEISTRRYPKEIQNDAEGWPISFDNKKFANDQIPADYPQERQARDNLLRITNAAKACIASASAK